MIRVKLRTYVAYAPDTEALQWLNREHTGKAHAPDNPSIELRQAHYALRQSSEIIVHGYLKPNGRVQPEFFEYEGRTYRLDLTVP